MKTLMLMIVMMLALASCQKDRINAHLQSTVFTQSCEIFYYAGGYLANQRHSHGYETYTFEVQSGDEVYITCDTNKTGMAIYLSVSVYAADDGTVLASQDVIVEIGEPGKAYVKCP